VEERLRRIADVQNAVRLHRVPAPLAHGESAVPAPSTPADHVRGTAIVLGSGPEKQPAPPDGRAPVPLEPSQTPQIFPVPRRRPVGRTVAALAAALTLVTGAAAFAANGGALPWNDEDGRAVADAPSAAPQSSSVRIPTATKAVLPTVLPAGFRWYDSKSGFRVAWPATWVKVGETRTSVTLCAPGGPPVVAVREWTPSDPDLATALRREETAAGLPSYKRLRMNVSPQRDSAEWEYTFTDPRMGALHGLDRAVLQNGRAYIVQFRTPAAKWEANSAKRSIVVGMFRPAATTVAARTGTPAGFVTYRSASGFQLATPAKWGKIDETRTSVLFCAPGGPPLVGVREWKPSNTDLAVALDREEELADLPRYKRVSMEVLPGGQGAVWEYTFTDPRMGRLHGLDRAFRTSTGAYLVQWRAPADEWAANLPKLGVVTSSFRTTQ
jgi:hypothetical protein